MEMAHAGGYYLGAVGQPLYSRALLRHIQPKPFQLRALWNLVGASIFYVWLA